MKAEREHVEPRLHDEVARIEKIINSPDLRALRTRDHARPQAAVRPRNAATIMLVDGKGPNARVLMGRRNRSLAFMPGALVFPGGSVDRADSIVPPADALDPATEAKILSALRGKPTQRRARAIGMAAVRELGEESGLLIGKPGALASAHPDWEEFRRENIVPCISGLVLFARAITPPGPSRRFDTWFFTAHADEIAYRPPGGLLPSGELEELQWLTPREAIEGPTREITRVMLVELMRWLDVDPALDPSFPVPFYFARRSRFRKTTI
ncbi:MAG: NUDIX hydrolase [Pseudomonadota bacterium]|nr:NUDIX hydrolase [Pseudomonadota bacterium]